MPTLDIIGAGVIGLSIAWRAAQRGWSVRVFDPKPARGASWAAGGMLAPFSEAWPGHESLLRLGVASLARWRTFAEDLAAFEAEGTVLCAQGTLLVGSTHADLETLAPGVACAQRFAIPAERRKGSELRSLEPSLAADLRGGWFLPEELAADNRALLVALRRAAARSGAQLVEKRVEDLSQNRADLVVVANGFQAPGLLPRLPVRAVKGEIVRLGRGPKAVEAPGRTIRALVRGRHVYLVPRPDGVVVGATELEGDARPDVSATAVAELLADAIAVAPGLADYDFAEASSGFRPVTPDRCPLLGWADEARRVLVATGHGRDGMLLAPLTADLAVALLAGDQLSAEESELSLAMDPSRSGLR